MELREYQKSAVDSVYTAWTRGAKNVCLQLATGGGKTACLAYIISNFNQPSIAIAHRTELVSQLSLTLAQYGVYHNIIATPATIKEIVTLHIATFGKSFYDQHAIRYVGGVLALLNNKAMKALANRIKLMVFDEAHHVLRNNTWGKAALLFPNAIGLFPTATPQRADGKGLGTHADGLIDELVVGVSMRELIDQGYLTKYRIISPPNDIDLSGVNITASGDYSQKKLRTAVHKSHIVGDAVEHYLRVAKGKLGITFAVDIESSVALCNAYRKAGVPAETISAKTPPLIRAAIMRRFKNREILQLVNVDILGEGVDVPAVEVVSMCRPTESYNMYAQQFGRMLRPSPGKEHGILIDHVNNWRRHGLPDAPRTWSLDRRERRGRSTTAEIPLKNCLNTDCFAVYPRTKRECPICGHYEPPRERSTPAQVDGDLTEIDESVLAAMRGEIARIDDMPRIPHNASGIVAASIKKNHRDRQQIQSALRDFIAQWAGYLREAGVNDAEIYRTFYFKFDTDILTAQTLGVKESFSLLNKLNDDIVLLANKNV